MFSVALVGPDGAGKTTLVRRLERDLPMPVKRIYMGFAVASSNKMSPLTRLVYIIRQSISGQSIRSAKALAPGKSTHKPQTFTKRALAKLRAGLRLLHWLNEELFRYGLAWYYGRRGYVVLFDRHFLFDSYVYDLFSHGLHRLLLERVYPRPDLVIYLDAPAQELFARKGEETIDALERRRQHYLELGHLVEHFVVIDTTQPEVKTASTVAKHIMDLYETRAGQAVQD